MHCFPREFHYSNIRSTENAVILKSNIDYACRLHTHSKEAMAHLPQQILRELFRAAKIAQSGLLIRIGTPANFSGPLHRRQNFTTMRPWIYAWNGTEKSKRFLSLSNLGFLASLRKPKLDNKEEGVTLKDAEVCMKRAAHICCCEKVHNMQLFICECCSFPKPTVFNSAPLLSIKLSPSNITILQNYSRFTTRGFFWSRVIISVETGKFKPTSLRTFKKSDVSISIRSSTLIW